MCLFNLKWTIFDISWVQIHILAWLWRMQFYIHNPLLKKALTIGSITWILALWNIHTQKIFIHELSQWLERKRNEEQGILEVDNGHKKIDWDSFRVFSSYIHIFHDKFFHKHDCCNIHFSILIILHIGYARSQRKKSHFSNDFFY